MKTSDSKVNEPTKKRPADAAAGKTIELSISLPSVPPIATKYSHLLNRLLQTPAAKKKSTIIAVAGGITVSAIAGGFVLAKILHSGDAAGQGYSIHQLPKENPTFATVAPDGKNINSSGGWTRISPPDRNAVYAFSDTINDTSINVSQQPLPESFVGNTEAKVEQMATSFLATEKVTTGSTTFYIGTASNGAQSVILTKNQLLILIKSTGKIEAEQWSKYISSLK